MTLKDYAKIASVINSVWNNSSPFYANDDKSEVLFELVAKMEEMFKQDNPRFNPNVFRSACYTFSKE